MKTKLHDPLTPAERAWLEEKTATILKDFTKLEQTPGIRDWLAERQIGTALRKLEAVLRQTIHRRH